MGVDNTPVEKLMSTDLLTVTPDTDINKAADILLDEGVGSLIVLDADDNLAGVLTSTDFVTVVSTNHSSYTGVVGDYMTEDVLTVPSSATLYNAAVKMIREDVQHLPVAGDGNEIVGMLSATDLTAQLTYMGSSGTD
ncbi:CBS domain-containing protein [Halorubrum ejinorense]|uniref:CBS domain-containing protein n=2 Tax=Halorubrum ejinorense TaxID=425309 RepID=A0AAV3STI1_9EURY